MKKALFFIAALALCMSANAKYWFGGTVGFGTQSYYDIEKNDRVLSFSPSFGMAIEDALELGVDLTIADPVKNGQQEFQFAFAPFLRYTFLTEGNFNMFVQGGFEYGVVSPSGYNYWHLAFNVQPGIRYMMSDHWSVVAKFDGLYYKHFSRPEQMYANRSYQNAGGFVIDFSALKFGLVYEF